MYMSIARVVIPLPQAFDFGGRGELDGQVPNCRGSRGGQVVGRRVLPSKSTRTVPLRMSALG